MRNLKKILALVLALVMTMSVMTVASAGFKDADAVAASKFSTAIDVLNGLGVFRGDEKGNFNPKGSITRAEVAAIIYRIDTGDVKDTQEYIYSDYNKFDDVKSTEWYAGYINYCANALYIKGYDEHTFGPNDKVTGYQVLAMILRAVGYDKNNEFSGSAWQIEVAKYANKLGITDTVNAETLGMPATRELVAELLFRTIRLVPQVTYTLALGYNQYQTTLVDGNSKLNPTIGEEMFGLSFHKNQVIDDWGRPGDYWYASKGQIKGVVAFYPYAPISTYTVATTECEIALDMGYDGAKAIPTIIYDNGVEKVIGINPIHEHVKVEGHLVGGTGTLLEVYADRIVMIETYLAEVTGVVKHVTDKAGHTIVAPVNPLHIYTGLDEENDWTYDLPGNKYAKGDYILVYVNEEYGYAVDMGVAPSFVATQTNIWYNQYDKHTLDKVEYLDNENFQLDDAQFDMSKQYIWFQDLYGNVIGDIELITPKTYAVVKNAQWVNEIGKPGYALCTLLYLDGTEEQVKISAVDGKATKYADIEMSGQYFAAASFMDGWVYTTLQYNDDTNYHLFEVVGSTLWQVEAHFDNAVIKDGISHVVADNGNFYTNNFTEYLFYNKYTGEYITWTGYDNVPKTIIADMIDVLYIDNGGFASFVYIYGYFYTAAPQDVTGSELVYFVGDEMNFYVTPNTFAMTGAVNGKGEAVTLHFAKNAFGTEEITLRMLGELAKLYQDTLCVVSTLNGIVIDVTPINLINGGAHGTNTIVFAAGGEYNFYENNEEIGGGVLMLMKAQNLALNVNETTTIFNDGEVGTIVDLKNAVLNNQNIYVVYNAATTRVSTIFITKTHYFSDVQKLYSLTAESFIDVTTVPYIGTVDAADVAAYVAETSEAIRFIKALAWTNYVQVNGVAVLSDNGRLAMVNVELYHQAQSYAFDSMFANGIVVTLPITLSVSTPR